MADSNPVSSMVSGLQSAYGLVKDIADLEQAREIKSQIAELMDQILSARENAIRVQERETALLGEIDDLKKQIDQMETWDSEKQQYQLQAIDSGAFAYVLKPEVQGDEPPHWLCPNCFENRQKRILQFRERVSTRPGTSRGDYSRWVCGSCRSELTVHYTRSPEKP